MIITPPQTVVWDAAVLTKDATFDEFSFSSAFGQSVLVDPFALYIDVDNKLTTDHIWFGVLITTTSGVFSVADRNIIGFCPMASQATISGQSVPSLAYISGEVRKITVRLYRTSPLIAAPPNNVTRVSLRIVDPGIQTGTLPYIGQDSLVLNPSIYFTLNTGFIPVAAGALDTQTLITTIPSFLRYKIIYAQIIVEPTPFPGDLQADFYIPTFATIGGFVFSETDRYNTYELVTPIYLKAGQNLKVECQNVNSTNSYQYKAFVTYEATN